MANDDKKVQGGTQNDAFEDKLAKGIAEGVKQALVAIEGAKTAAATAVDKAAEQEAKDNAEILLAKKSACPKCGQPKRGCGFKEFTLADGTKKDNHDEVHIRLIVRPEEEMFAEYFTGVQINGVTYFSSSQREAVVCPRNSQIMVSVRNYQRREMEARVGKNRSPFSMPAAAN